MSVLRWLYRRRHLIAVGIAGLVALYGVLRVLVPGHFCHAAGYVVASIVSLVIVSMMLAEESVRRRP